MNFLDALRSGAPFRRKGWAYWIWHDPSRGFLIAKADEAGGPGTFRDYWAFDGRGGGIQGFLADDYEIWGEPAHDLQWLEYYE